MSAVDDPVWATPFTRTHARAAMRDSGATSEELYRSVRFCLRQVLAHPMMGVLSIADPKEYFKILERVRERRAVRGYERIVEPLPLQDKKRIVIAALRYVNDSIGDATESQHDGLARLAHVLEAVVERQISPLDVMAMVRATKTNERRAESTTSEPTAPTKPETFMLANAIGLAMMAVLGKRHFELRDRSIRKGQEAYAAISALHALVRDPKGEEGWGVNDYATMEWAMAEAKKLNRHHRRVVLKTR